MTNYLPAGPGRGPRQHHHGRHRVRVLSSTADGDAGDDWRLLALVVLLSCGGGRHVRASDTESRRDPPEVVARRASVSRNPLRAAILRCTPGDSVNAPVSAGDPVMEATQTTGAAAARPVSRAVDELSRLSPRRRAARTAAAAACARTPTSRAAARSPRATTAGRRRRATRRRWSTRRCRAPEAFFLHFDGEFASAGRSGARHVHRPQLRLAAHRERHRRWRTSPPSFAAMTDAGRLAADFGALPYRVVLRGTDCAIPGAYRPAAEHFRLDVDGAERHADPRRGGHAGRRVRRVARLHARRERRVRRRRRTTAFCGRTACRGSPARASRRSAYSRRLAARGRRAEPSPVRDA